MKHLIVLIVGVYLAFGFTTSKTKESYTLFHIGRSRDSNIIKYDLNLTTSGNINTANPIKFYWIKNTEGGKIEGLSYTQEKFAYGIKYISKKSDEVKFQFVSYAKRTFVIKKVTGDKFKVITYLDKKGVEVKSIHVQFGGGTFNLPKISYVNMYWQDPFNGKEGTESIKP